jgi:nucleoside-diphosphate-sugar epimerase
MTQNRRFFITGAQGFVGRYLVAQLLSTAGAIHVLGVGRSPRLDQSFTHVISWGAKRLLAPLPAGLQEVDGEARYHYVAADLRQSLFVTQLLRDFQPQVIIHLASGLRDDPPYRLLQSNIEGTVQLITAIADSGIEPPRLVLCSTGGVYGIPDVRDLPLKENGPCLPVDFYAATKLGCEHTSRVLARRYGLPTVWARVFNIVGAGQDERHVCGTLARQLAMIKKRALPPSVAVGSLAATRDFIDVRDVCRALHILAERGQPGDAYNVASGVESSIHTVLQTMVRLTGLEESISIHQQVESRVDIPRHFADIGRLAALGFRCQYTLERSLKDLLQYYAQTVANAVERCGEDEQSGQP